MNKIQYIQEMRMLVLLGLNVALSCACVRARVRVYVFQTELCFTAVTSQSTDEEVSHDPKKRSSI